MRPKGDDPPVGSISSRTIMRPVAILFAGVLVFSACGDSDSSSADPERFCELVEELDAQDTSGMPANEALPILEEGRAKYEEGLEVVPDEIRADAEVFATYVLEVTDLLIAAGGDESQVDAATVDAVSDEGVGEAGRKVTAWRLDNCS
jgi:hypothetical protein